MAISSGGQFYEARKKGLKSITGCEVYVAPTG
jgi:hypothetical protein